MPNAHATDREPILQRSARRGPISMACLGLGLALAVSGCASSINTLSAPELAGLRIEGVDVRYGPNAIIWWRKGKVAYLREPGVEANVKRKVKMAEARADAFEQDEASAESKVLNSPEAKAFVRKKLSAMITSRLAANVLPLYQGTRPVRLEVTVYSFAIPSPFMRVVVGGAPTLSAVTVLKDAKTGAELARLDKMAAGTAFSGALGVALDQAGADLEDRVLRSYTQNVLRWLSTPSSGRPS